jgi:hypothetical protein
MVAKDGKKIYLPQDLCKKPPIQRVREFFLLGIKQPEDDQT